jgi:hypothetical protein
VEFGVPGINYNDSSTFPIEMRDREVPFYKLEIVKEGEWMFEGKK